MSEHGIELWHLFAISFIAGVIFCHLLRRNWLAICLAGVSGWSIIGLPSCAGMTASYPPAANESAEEFFLSLVMSPAFILAGLFGLSFTRLIQELHRNYKEGKDSPPPTIPP
jgi:hypothetical protein